MTSASPTLTETDVLRLLDRGCNAIYVVDAETGRFLHVNEKACEMTGYDSDELLGMHVSELEVNLDRRISWESFVDGIRDHPSFTIRGEHRHKNGSTFPVEVDNDLIELDGDEYVLSVIRNLSEQDDERDEIIEHYDYYRKLSKYSPVALMEMDASEAVDYTGNLLEETNGAAEGLFEDRPELFRELYDRTRILDINDATVELFNASDREEFVEGIPEILLPETREKIKDSYVNMIEGNMGRNLETRLKTLDGYDRYVLFDYMVPPENRDEFSRIFVAMVDITPRRRAEQELRESLRVKETLLEEVHHRVKNNMQIVGSLLNTQARTVDSDRARKAFENSLDRVRTMAMVHEKLYDSDQLAQFDFESFMRDLCESLVDLHGNENVEVTLEVSMDPATLELDTAISCGLIVNELVSNSFKHGLDGVEEDRLEIAFRQREGEEHELVVSDNGTGLPEDESPFQEESAGLSILKALVEYELDGTLEIQSRNGFRANIVFDV